MRPVRLGVAILLCVVASAPAQTFRSFGGTKDTTRVSVFADGNIRAVATGTQENTAGTGALGVVIETRRVQWSGSVTVASTVDTLRGRPGAGLLSPGTGRHFQSGLLDLRVENVFSLFGMRMGIHSYASAGKSVWALDSATLVEAVVFAIGASMFHGIAQGKVGENPIALTVEAGLAARKVGGDVGFRDSLRTAFLGSATTAYFGLEGGMQIRFNSIVTGIQLYYLRDFRRGRRVDGLTHIQLVGGFSVQGPIFSGPLVKD